MTNSDIPIIQLSGVSKRYKNLEAVSNFTLEVISGELFGLVGPDGAGKTTILRVLAGLLALSDGEGSINGHDLRTESEKIKKNIGYMAQQFSLYAELNVVENLKFFADLYDVPSRDIADRTDRLLDFANLKDFRTRRADQLSGGMQKKLALACCLIHEPDILFLDEPTTGVDPISRREFWNILSDLHIAGNTILVSTPYMDEADRCSRVGLMYQGSLLKCESPKKIRSSLDADMIVLIPDKREGVEKILADIQGVIEIQTYGDAFHILVDDAGKALKPIKRALKSKDRSFRELRVSLPRMEEAFISLMKGMEG